MSAVYSNIDARALNDALAINRPLSSASTGHPPFLIRQFAAPLGAQVLDLDLNRPLHEDAFSLIRKAFADHHVLVFRKQDITPQQHVAFSRRFGPLQIHVLKQFQLPGHQEILQISNIRENGKPIGLGDAGAFWHSDLSYKAIPSLGSLLHARELPTTGGDTHFSNMHLAWETLPATLQKTLLPLKAEHTYIKRYEEQRAKAPWRPALTQAQLDEVRPVVHPVVTTHPENGRKTLFVNEHFTSRIVGLPMDESDDLLQQLFAHSIRPEFIYTHRWEEDDMVFWDNRSVIHLAGGTPDDQRRRLNRTTVEGTVPV